MKFGSTIQEFTPYIMLQKTKDNVPSFLNKMLPKCCCAGKFGFIGDSGYGANSWIFGNGQLFCVYKRFVAGNNRIRDGCVNRTSPERGIDPSIG